MRKTLLLLFLLSPVFGFADQSDEDYRLIESSGPVAVIPAGGQEPLKASVGLPLSEGDRVVTGSGGAVEIAAKNGSVIRLDANTSMGIQSMRSTWISFRIYVGRFLGKFQKSSTSRYDVHTPVAVASVRGTEFALDVSEEGALEAGVVEGEVAISPVEIEDGNQPAGSAEWMEEILKADQGLQVRPLERPVRLKNIPKPLQGSMAWFPHARQRVPKIREQWKELNVPERIRLRQQSLRERVQWTLPPKADERIQPLRERVPSHREKKNRKSMENKRPDKGAHPNQRNDRQGAPGPRPDRRR